MKAAGHRPSRPGFGNPCPMVKKMMMMLFCKDSSHTSQPGVYDAFNTASHSVLMPFNQMFIKIMFLTSWNDITALLVQQQSSWALPPRDTPICDGHLHLSRVVKERVQVDCSCWRTLVTCQKWICHPICVPQSWSYRISQGRYGETLLMRYEKNIMVRQVSMLNLLRDKCALCTVHFLEMFRIWLFPVARVKDLMLWQHYWAGWLVDHEEEAMNWGAAAPLSQLTE